MNWSCDWSRVALALIVVFMSLGTPYLWAQTLGTAPVFNTAVPGQTGAQPEGAFKNFVNWIGNVVAPIGAGGAVFGAVVAFMSGRTFGRWLLASAHVAGDIGRHSSDRVLGSAGSRRSFVVGGFAGAAFRKALSPIAGPLSSSPRRSACRLHKFLPTLFVS